MANSKIFVLILTGFFTQSHISSMTLQRIYHKVSKEIHKKDWQKRGLAHTTAFDKVPDFSLPPLTKKPDIIKVAAFLPDEIIDVPDAQGYLPFASWLIGRSTPEQLRSTVTTLLAANQVKSIVNLVDDRYL